MSLRLLLLFAALLGSAPVATAQSEQAPNGVFLVATPTLFDPNFHHSVVLVTQTPDGGTVGFILNRPGRRSLAELVPNNDDLKRFTEPLYLGGPVGGSGLFAVFRAKENPPGALRVLDDVSFAMDRATVEGLLHSPPESVRFFNGYAGWMQGQLAAELGHGDWYVVNADADTVFRQDVDKLWDELVKRARAITAMLR